MPEAAGSGRRAAAPAQRRGATAGGAPVLTGAVQGDRASPAPAHGPGKRDLSKKEKSGAATLGCVSCRAALAKGNLGYALRCARNHRRHELAHLRSVRVQQLPRVVTADAHPAVRDVRRVLDGGALTHRRRDVGKGTNLHVLRRAALVDRIVNIEFEHAPLHPLANIFPTPESWGLRPLPSRKRRTPEDELAFR